MQCVNKIKSEDHPEIRTILIGEPQKIILSPRVEFRRIIKHPQQHELFEQDDNEPRIQIIAKPMPPCRPVTDQVVAQQQQLSPHHQQQQQQQVRVIKDGRFYEECSQNRQQNVTTNTCTAQQPQQNQEPRKFIVTRQINVMSPDCDNQVFRTPVVSSTSSSMRPPPPPPPPKLKTLPPEEPSSSIPDLGEFF
jgi:hypothetical protein